MTTIRGMLEKVRELNRQLPTEIPRIVQQTSYEIETLNKQQLYNYGVRSSATGVNSKVDKLSPYKSKYYAKEKNIMNPRPGYGVPDLFLTGKFYQGFTVVVKQNSFEVDSVDSKSESIKKRYGDDIFGLTGYNTKVYALGVFYTQFKKFVTLKTGLEFS